MCYKTEKHQKIEKRIEKYLKGMPSYLEEYLLTIRGSRTKKVNLLCIKRLFEFLIREGDIEKSISEIGNSELKK